MHWDEFATGCPEIAGLGEERLRRNELCLVGTLRQDGSPRISPCEPDFAAGQLLLGMMWQSKKALDLLRDPRVYVHAPVTAKEGSPEFKLAGRADVLTDEGLRTKLDDLWWEMIEWRPAADSHYFEFLAQRAAWVTYDGKGQTRVVWKLGRPGEKRLYKAGI